MELYRDYLDNREELIKENLACYARKKTDKAEIIMKIILATILIFFWLLAIYILFYSNKGKEGPVKKFV